MRTLRYRGMQRSSVGEFLIGYNFTFTVTVPDNYSHAKRCTTRDGRRENAYGDETPVISVH